MAAGSKNLFVNAESVTIHDAQRKERFSGNRLWQMALYPPRERLPWFARVAVGDLLRFPT
jgi:hypothetical protein